MAGPMNTGGGHLGPDAQRTFAPSPYKSHGNNAVTTLMGDFVLVGPQGGQPAPDTHRKCAPLPLNQPGGHGVPATPTSDAAGQLISRITMLHRDREDFIKEERSLTLRMKARIREYSSRSCPDHAPSCARCKKIANDWGDGKLKDDRFNFHNSPLLLARQPVTYQRQLVQREMERLAAQLPVADFVEQTRGFTCLGLAKIIGEAGDLSHYSNPAKLWKRMGLAVINGRAQRRVAGCGKSKCKATCDRCLEAIAHGFSPKRRAVMFVIGDSLVKQGREYHEVYLSRKRYLSAKHEGCEWIENSKNPKDGCAYCHKGSQRYMEKRLLRDLWKAWQGAEGGTDENM